MSWTQRLAELGITLPPVAKPVAAYVPAVRPGASSTRRGQLPIVDGALPVTGKVGETAEGWSAGPGVRGRLTVRAQRAGRRRRPRRPRCDRPGRQGGRFRGLSPGFTGQPKVINGASEVLGEIFGDAGVHARSAVGVAELPLGARRGGADRRGRLNFLVLNPTAQPRHHELLRCRG